MADVAEPDAIQLPQPLRLWEVLLVQATIAVAIGLWANLRGEGGNEHYLRGLPDGPAWWGMVVLSTLRVGVAPLLAEDFFLGERRRWTGAGRLAIFTLIVWEWLRWPAVHEFAVTPEGWVGGIVAVLAAFDVLGRRADRWSMLPFALLLLHPAWIR